MSIDRFEGSFAVCFDDSGACRDIPLALLPEGAREGEMLEVGGDGILRLSPDETARRRKAIASLQSALFL